MAPNGYTVHLWDDRHMTMKNWLNKNLDRKIEEIKRKNLPLPLYALQIPL